MSEFEKWCYDHCFSVTNPWDTRRDVSVIRTDDVIELFRKLESVFFKEIFGKEIKE